MSDAPHLGYVGDGGNYHVQKWLPALVRAGIQVTLISYDAPESPLPGVGFSPLHGRVRSRPSYLDYLRSARFVRHAIHAADCDVVMGSYATHYGFLTARAGFGPFIMQTWTGDLTLYPFRGPKRFWFGPVVRYGLRRADLITTDGSALLKLGRERYPAFAEKMVATRWGINTATVDQGRKDPDLAQYSVVTAPRGLQHWYEPEIVLDAMLQLLSRQTTAFVIVLTLGHKRSLELQQRLDELDSHPRARVVDRFLDQQEMANIWHDTDIVVSIPHADGVSESVLEAAYAGALPVLSDIPSNRSLIGDGLAGEILKTSTTDCLVETIERALQTPPAVTTSRSRQNRRWVMQHATVDATATQLAGQIRRLVVEKRGDRTGRQQASGR